MSLLKSKLTFSKNYDIIYIRNKKVIYADIAKLVSQVIKYNAGVP